MSDGLRGARWRLYPQDRADTRRSRGIRPAALPSAWSVHRG